MYTVVRSEMKQCSWWFLAVLTLCLPSMATEQSGTIDLQQRVVTVDVFQAKQLFDLGAVFVDVRSNSEWQLGHIANALHLDFQRDFENIRTMTEIDQQTPLVIYCSSSECLLGAYASAVSAFWGYQNVFYFRAGYFGWMLQDFPVVMNLSARLEK